MYDRALVFAEITEIEEAIRRIERRFKGISSAQDLTATDEGLDRLDSIAMMLIVIGESIKKIDKITQGKALNKHPEIHWPGVKSTRDILARDYAHIDPEEIYTICESDIAPLKRVLQMIKKEVDQN